MDGEVYLHSWKGLQENNKYFKQPFIHKVLVRTEVQWDGAANWRVRIYESAYNASVVSYNWNTVSRNKKTCVNDFNPGGDCKDSFNEGTGAKTVERYMTYWFTQDKLGGWIIAQLDWAANGQAWSGNCLGSSGRDLVKIKLTKDDFYLINHGYNWSKIECNVYKRVKEAFPRTG